MTTSVRKIFRDFLLYGGSDFAWKLLGFVTLPIYTRIFTTAEYGILSYTFSFTLLLMSVVLVGGDQVYVRFYFEADGDEERRTLTPTWLLFLALWGSLVALALLPWSGALARWSFEADGYAPLIVVAILGVPVGLINRVCGHVLRARFQPGLGAALNLATAAMSIVFGLIGAVPLGMGLFGIFAGILVAEIVMLPLRLWSVRPLLRPRFSLSLLRRALAFGIPLVPTVLAAWVFTMSDRLMLSKLASLEEVGLYSVAAALVSVISLANVALAQAWGPHAVVAYERTPARAPAFYGQIMTYVLASFGLLCVAVTTFGAEILHLLTVQEFYPAAKVIGPLALGIVAYATSQVTGIGVILRKKTKRLAVLSVCAAALNIVLNLVLIPRFGMMGAAWATAFSYLALTLGYLVAAQRLFATAYERRRGLTIIVLLVAFTLGVEYLPSLPLASSLALKGTYFAAFIGALFLLRAFDRREIEALRMFCSRAWRRGG